MASVSGIFLGFSLAYRTQPVAVAVENVRHGARRGQHVFGKTPGSQLLEGFRCGQSGERQGALEGRVLLRMGLRQNPQHLSHIRMLLLPQLVAGKGRVRTQTNDARAFLMQSQLHRLATPTKHLFRLPRTPRAVLQRHRRLKGSSIRPRHFGCRKFEVIYMTSIRNGLVLRSGNQVHQGQRIVVKKKL